jgi:hypothetical protein
MSNRFSLAFATALFVAIGCVAAPAHAQVSKEGQVKAALLFNCGQYFDFPSSAFASASAPLVIGFFGDCEFRPALEAGIAGKTAKGRPIEVQTVASATDAAKVHILYVSSGNNPAAIAKQLNGSPVLTVAETESFLDDGGVVKFLLENNKVRFSISTANAGKAGLKIDEKLLKLAK